MSRIYKKKAKSSLLFKLLFLFLFTVIYCAARLPVIHEPLEHEEGIFAELMVHCPTGPNYGLGGRVDGQNVYNPLSHPSGLYELLRFGGKLASPFLQDPIYLDDAVVTPRLRLLCSLYQYSIWIIIVLVLFSYADNIWPFILLLATALSPLAIKTSALLQTDNTAGVTLCGAASLLIYFADNFIRKERWQITLYGTAGFAVGLGKQEWSIGLFIAILVSIALNSLWFRNIDFKKMLFVCGYVVIGLLIGNIVSYLYNSQEYIMSFGVMKEYSVLSDKTTSNWLLNWISMQKYWLPFLTICFTLQGLAVFYLLHNNRGSFSGIVIVCFVCVLLLSYYLFNRNSDIRYFSASLPVSLIGCIAVMPAVQSFRLKIIMVMIAGITLVMSIIFMIGFTPYHNVELKFIQDGVLKSSTDTVLYINSAAGWNKPNIDYFNNTLEYESVKKRVENMGKKLVRPDPKFQSMGNSSGQ